VAVRCDRDAAARVAHDLVGTAATIGATRLAIDARDLERALASTGEDYVVALQAVRAAFVDVMAAVASVRPPDAAETRAGAPRADEPEA